MSEHVPDDFVAGYDPSANPRNLSAVPNQDSIEALATEAARVQERIDRYQQVLGMMASEAWKTLDAFFLYPEVQKAVNALADPKTVNTAEALAYVQGQLNTLTWLRSLGNHMQNVRDIDRQQIQSIQAAVEEANQTTAP